LARKAASLLRMRQTVGNRSKTQSSLRLLKHPEQRGFGAFADGFFHFDARLEGVEAVAKFLQGVHFHVPAIGAGAAIGGAGDEVFVRAFLAQPVEHAAFGDDDDVFHRCVFAVGDHLFGRANFVGQQTDGLRAFRVGDDESVGKFRLDAADRFAGELDVDVTRTLPEIHFPTGLLHDPCAKIGVGDEKDRAVNRCLVDNFHRVAGSANDIAESFHTRRAVDVGDDVVVLLGVFDEIRFELIGGAGLLERATGVGIGKDDDFSGVHDFRSFRHEMDTAENDHVRIRVLCLVGEAERISDVVAKILNVAGLVIVDQNHGVAGLFESEDFLLEIEGDDGHGRRVKGGV